MLVKLSCGFLVSALTNDFASVFCSSIERYFGICYPLQSRVRRRRLLVYLIPVIFTWYHIIRAHMK